MKTRKELKKWFDDCAITVKVNLFCPCRYFNMFQAEAWRKDIKIAHAEIITRRSSDDLDKPTSTEISTGIAQTRAMETMYKILHGKGHIHNALSQGERIKHEPHQNYN